MQFSQKMESIFERSSARDFADNVDAITEFKDKRGAHYAEVWAEMSDYDRENAIAHVGSNPIRAQYSDLERATRGMTDSRRRELMAYIADSTDEEMDTW